MKTVISYFITILIFSSSELFSQVKHVVFTPLDDNINTTDTEELGRWTLDGQSIIFTRLSAEKDELLMARLDSQKNWEPVEKFPIDTSYKGGGHAISPDGTLLIFTLCNRKDGIGGCDLYYSNMIKGNWTPAKNMGPSINGRGWESQAIFGSDDMTIYFASTRPGGFGGSDIWMSRKLQTGAWSPAVNAGPGVNTRNNEGSPFVHFDGRTMYFMRDGSSGLGGYDLYLSHIGIDDTWQNAKNLGTSINTASDEGGMSLHPNGKTALITIATPDNKNDLVEFELPEEFQSTPVQALFVNVINAESGLPVKSELYLFQTTGKDTISKSQYTDSDGNLTLDVDRNTSFGLIAIADGFLMNSIHLPPSSKSYRQQTIKLTPVNSTLAKAISLENIFFTTGSFSLLSSSKPELNILAESLQRTPQLQIEIHGHTDNIGSDEHNQKLSEERAKAVYEYLVNKGVDRARISYKGFGENKPVASNETEEGRKQNRRTEFIIKNP